METKPYGYIKNKYWPIFIRRLIFQKNILFAQENKKYSTRETHMASLLWKYT